MNPELMYQTFQVEQRLRDHDPERGHRRAARLARHRPAADGWSRMAAAMRWLPVAARYARPARAPIPSVRTGA